MENYEDKITRQEDSRLMRKIEKLRAELYEAINKHGLNSKESLAVSKKIDILINKFYENKKEVEFPEGNEMYEQYKESYLFLKKISSEFGEFPSIELWQEYAKKYLLLNAVSMQYISGCTWHQLRDKIYIEKI